MLRSMRQITDRYQKPILVALAAFLMVIFVLPIREAMRRPGYHVIGTFRGHKVWAEEVQSLRDRWLSLDLLSRGFFRDPRANYIMLLAARDAGVRVGSQAVTQMLRLDPPARERIEYILADPERLAEQMTPSDAQLRAYHAANWQDKTQPFDKVIDEVRRKVQVEMAKVEAVRRIRQAAGIVAAAPRTGDGLRQALSDAAKRTNLEHLTSEMFSEQTAALALSRLAETAPDELSVRSGARPRLPDSLAKLLFQIRVGVPSEILRSGDRWFIFRIIESSAGIASDGSAEYKDWGWLNGEFRVLREYESYRELIKAKRRMTVSEALRTFEEFLTVQKYVDLVCGGSEEAGAFLTTDAHAELSAVQTEQRKALVAEIPVRPFRPEAQPSEKDIQSFYDARKNRDGGPNHPNFGYRQPARVQIEYVLAEPDAFKSQVRISDDDVRRYYDKNKDKEFLGPDGKTPKPFEEVSAGIRRDMESRSATERAERRLKDILNRAETDQGEAVPLEPLATGPGIRYRKSGLFSRDEIRSNVPELAESSDFAEHAFAENMQPKPLRTTRGQTTFFYPLSPILQSGSNLFFFRLAQYVPSAPKDFGSLSAAEQMSVAEDLRHARAVDRAKVAALDLRTSINKQVLATIANENGLPIQKATLKPGEADAGTTPVPPALERYLSTQLKRAPGEFAQLVRDADTCYTAVTSKLDDVALLIEFIQFTESQFKAAFQPPQGEIEARAAELRDADLKKNGKPEDPYKEKPEPTDEQKAAARQQLIDEWQKKPFTARYLAYVRERVQTTFRTHAEAHPVEVKRDVRLERITSPEPFREDDSYALGGDKALLAAAFKMEPGQLSGPVVGDSAVAIIMVDGAPESRTERKFEILTARHTEYDPLDVTITDADAGAYYKAHEKDFEKPARASAEFIFASFDNIAASLAASITSERIEAYFNERTATAYKGRVLDTDLRRDIGRELAREEARMRAAEEAIKAAHAAAANAPAEPFAGIANSLAAQWKLVAATTPLLGPGDDLISHIGSSPSLREAILAAKKGELSAPMRAGEGWVIFRVVETVPAHTPKLEDCLPEVRAKAREARLKEKARKAIAAVEAVLATDKTAKMEDLLKRPELADLFPISFRPAATTTGFLDPERAKAEQEMSDALRKAAFEAKPGEMTPIVETPEGLQVARILEEKTNRLIRAHYILIRADLFTTGIEVTDEEAKMHFEAQQDKYKRGRTVEAELLLAEEWQLQEDIPVTDAELKNAYEQLKHEFIDGTATSEARTTVYRSLEAVRSELTTKVKQHKARQKAEAVVREAIAAVEKDKAKMFKDLAAEIKGLRHVASAEYELGKSVPAIPGLEAFLTTAKEGDVSPVLRTFSATAVLRVKKAEPAGIPPFEKVKAKVKEDIAKERALIKARETAGRVAEQIKQPASPESMSHAASGTVVPSARRVPVRVRETQYLSRWDYDRQCHSLVPALFGLIPGEISGVPIADGERAESCFLATPTGRRVGAPEEGGERRNAAMERALRFQSFIRRLFEEYKEIATLVE